MKRLRRKPADHERDRRRRQRILASIIGMAMAGSGAYAVSNWLVGLNGGSNGLARSGTVDDLTIVATSSPAASNLLYPGGEGDVVVSISNPNPFPVTISAFGLPADTVDANGYVDSGLTTQQSGCTASTPSGVTWNFETASSGTSHTLTTPITVAANGQSNDPLIVTLTNDASMASDSPAACEATYFSMPSFTGVTAAASTDPPATSPTTDSWTS